ncbi:hypothetical protein [Rhizobium bangladeshense]|uniref:hypothetical protein n=1 Tax=Rhizobium bangladeshense TaxID=1138189 RepID=UPI000A778DB9|nr:hypothetical protein [Rhizobium bangladeshense]
MPNNPDWWKWVRLAFQRIALSQAGNPETGDRSPAETAAAQFRRPKKLQLRLRSYDYHHGLY